MMLTHKKHNFLCPSFFQNLQKRKKTKEKKTPKYLLHVRKTSCTYIKVKVIQLTPVLAILPFRFW